jgi:hypothetical protein
MDFTVSTDASNNPTMHQDLAVKKGTADDQLTFSVSLLGHNDEGPKPMI